VIIDCTKAIDLAPENERTMLADIYRGRAEAYRQSGQFSMAKNDEESAHDLAG
jgi:hypothetical protein